MLFTLTVPLDVDVEIAVTGKLAGLFYVHSFVFIVVLGGSYIYNLIQSDLKKVRYSRGDTCP
jgi:hypothetical protein